MYNHVRSTNRTGKLFFYSIFVFMVIVTAGSIWSLIRPFI